jgi:hypothetical protein
MTTLNLNPKQFKSSLMTKDRPVITLPDGSQEELIDLHSASCVAVYCAADDPDNHTANQNVKLLALSEDPSVDVDSYMEDIRNGDRAATLRLIALVAGGLTKLAEEAVGGQ